MDVDLVVVLEVGADTGKVDNDGDVELLELVGGTDTAELQELRRVVCSTGDDDLARSSCRSGNTSVAAVLGAGLVEVLAVKEFDTSGARRRRFVEGDLGNVAVGPDIKRESLCATGSLGIPNSNHEFSGATALAISG